MAEHFTDPDVWGGGAFALVILAGSRAERTAAEADARLDSVLRAVWAAPGLDGPYARRDVAPERQQRVAPTLRAQQEHGLSGVARLPAGSAVCATQVVRDDPGEHDWVYVDLPLIGLHRLGLVVEGPEPDATVRALLLEVGRAVYADVSFEAAGIGHELLGPDVLDHVGDVESFR